MNQYSSITAAPFRTVVGRAPAAAAVAVNGTTLGAQHRTGEVFHFQLPLVSNVNSPVWLPASVNSQGTTIDRHFFVPKQVTAPQHDLDGNLVNDGRWVYLWDAENRLIQMESTVAAVQAGAPYRKLVFHYDAGGRRLAKTVYQGTAAAPVFASSTRWLYDGWNPISEFSGTADTGGTITRTKSYTWGPGLSGTSQGAGGLLAVIVHTGFTNSAYYPSYDGNGNIVAWTLEGTPAPVSRREYDAFGNILVDQGVAPSAYGFSTKMQDVETGLYYYGYRFYDPVTGRWPSRDPIDESGGINLYNFVGNNGVNRIDYLGLVSEQEVWNMLMGPFIQAATEIGDSVSTTLEGVSAEIEKGFEEWKSHAKLKGQWKKEWRKKVDLVGSFKFQTGIGYKASSDGCCVKVTGYGFGQFEGKVPLFTVGVSQINLVGRVGGSIEGSYQYCWGSDETKWDGGWKWYLSGGVQAEFGRDVIVAKAKFVVEAGASFSRYYSFRDKTWDKMQFGMYLRAYAEWGVGWWDEREEWSVSKGNAAFY